MNLSVGIVGLPNAGKSTLFNALLKKQVAFAANFPFATIEPNIGVVPVPDERLPKIAKIVKTEKIVPATIKFVDIAGLIAGASKGEGLGNKFLSHIREVDLICHVVRYFSDPSVVHVAGDVDPNRDKDTIDAELILADLETLNKQPEPRMNATKEDIISWEIINKLKKEMNEGKNARAVLNEKELEIIRNLHLLTAKPVIFVFNVSENEIAQKSQEIINDDQLKISAKIESELASLNPEEEKAYLKELNLDKTGLERLIQKSYAKLGLISYLTGGEKEARAWTIKKGTAAPQAAGVIHTDFEQYFIKAEVIPCNDFIKYQGWPNARQLGKVAIVGKDYLVRDGDVIDFKIGS